MLSLKNNILPISILLLVIFHSVGLVNVLIGNGEAIMSLSYINLIISSFVLFLNHKAWNSRIIVKLIIVAILGYSIEVIGVHTGVPFGEYTYGQSLGFQLFDVPLMMGIIWIILCYITLKFGVTLFKHNISSIIFASFIMTLLDFLIEPVAIKYDFWMWFNDGVETPHSIPFQNYIAWFLFSIFLNSILVSELRNSQNKSWPYLLVIMTLFFVTLNIII